MVIELYSHWVSTSCTMVQLLSHHVGCEMEVKELCVFPTEENVNDRLQANVNIRAMERINFFSGNSRAKVPFMVIDRKSVITDTKAILKYFGEKYTEDDLLYPTNKQDEIDTSVSFAIDELHDLVVKVYYSDVLDRKPQESAKIEEVNEVLKKVEEFLSENEFICGDNLTVADFCFAVVTSTLEVVNHDMSNFPKTMSYFSKCKELIRGWEEIGEFRATRYGQWYRAAVKAAESGGCPYFPKSHKTVDDNTVVYSSDIELYSYDLLPKCIMIQLLARTLELPLVIKKTDLFHQEENVESRNEADENWKMMLKHLHFSDNEEAEAPPILVDNGKVIVETEKILKYLVKRRSTADICLQLYPSDSATRELVETQLASDLDTLDTLVLETYFHCFENVSTKQEIDQDKVGTIKETLCKLEEILQQSDFMAGNDLTIADFAYAVTLSVLRYVDTNILSEFKKLSSYLKRCKETIKDWDDIGETGSQLLGKYHNDCVNWTQNGNCPYYNG